MHADRGHIHHRIIDMGFNQKQAVAISYMMTAILGLAAVVLTTSGALRALFLIGAVFMVGAIGLKVIFSSHEGSRHAAKENGPPGTESDTNKTEEKGEDGHAET